jgi:hypothetical protein
VAVTVLDVDIVTWHVVATPEQAPTHPANTEPGTASA